ncbi:MAG: GtrA family protein, partial [Defluviitaleaceae bacterium]|nr:GtrA family protein [Defluviitaleaceae bacterium]
FAFVTNKIYFFESRTANAANILREIAVFFAARLFSGIVTVAAMWFFVDRLGANGLLILTICQIFVIIFNYVASKWIIFRRKK